MYLSHHELSINNYSGEYGKPNDKADPGKCIRLGFLPYVSFKFLQNARMKIMIVLVQSLFRAEVAGSGELR